MAHRDKKQGFAFVYVDAQKMLDRVRKQPVDAPMAVEAGPAPKFNFTLPTANKKSPEAVKKIKDNLDRLQALHHKLHAMLAELNEVAEKKKPRGDDS